MAINFGQGLNAQAILMQALRRQEQMQDNKMTLAARQQEATRRRQAQLQDKALSTVSAGHFIPEASAGMFGIRSANELAQYNAIAASQQAMNRRDEQREGLMSPEQMKLRGSVLRENISLQDAEAGLNVSFADRPGLFGEIGQQEPREMPPLDVPGLPSARRLGIAEPFVERAALSTQAQGATSRRDLRKDIAGEQRAAVIGRETAAINREGTEFNRIANDITQSLAEEIAANGKMSEPSRQNAIKALGPKEASYRFSQANAMAAGVKAKRFAEFKTQTGIKALSLDAEMEDFNEVRAAVNDPYRMTKSQAAAILNGSQDIDPAFPVDENGHIARDKDGRQYRVISGRFSAKKNKKGYEARAAIPSTMGNLNRFRELMFEAEEKISRDPSVRFQLRGLLAGTTAAGMRRKLGTTDPTVARIDTLMRLMVRDLIRMSNDPRPSDFDVRFFSEMLPIMNEIIGPDGKINPTAMARLDELQQRVDRLRWLPYDRANVLREMATPHTNAEKARMRSQMKSYVGEGGGEQGELDINALPGVSVPDLDPDADLLELPPGGFQ